MHVFKWTRFSLRVFAIGFLVALGSFGPVEAGGDGGARTEPVGGNGGQPFEFTVPGYITGFRLSQGNWLDRVTPLFKSVSPSGEISDAQINTSLMAGGNGGTPKNVKCPKDNFVVGLRVTRMSGQPPIFVANLEPVCENRFTRARKVVGTGWVYPDGANSQQYRNVEGPNFQCAAGDAAVGIHGAAGDSVDRIGLICRALPDVVFEIPGTNPVANTPTTESALAENCPLYANNAIADIAKAHQAGCNLQGDRYVADVSAHLNWCMSAGLDAAVREQQARQTEVNTCLAKVKPPEQANTPEPAKNTDAAACDTYAQDAVNDIIRAGQVCDLPKEPRYTTRYQDHFNWCMQVGSAKTDGERQARKKELRQCL